MYNEANVQPQNLNTGHGGSDTGEQIMPGSALPAPESPHFGSLAVPEGQIGASNTPSTGENLPESPEQWVNKVEDIFARTTQDPRQRAEQLNKLRSEYQQKVLGQQPAGRDE
jgi:hypothetical protein